MSLILIEAYLLLWFANGYLLVSKKQAEFVFFISCCLLFLLMNFKTGVAPVNGIYLDQFYYELDYNRFSFSLDRVQNDLSNYYLFYTSEWLGHFFNLSYIKWWAVVSFFSLVTINCVHKKFEYNKHAFLFYFFFFVIAIYASLKQYLGFCTFVIAISFLVRNDKYDRIKFFILLLIAGGFHLMYYFFIVLLFIDMKFIKPKYVFFIGSCFCFFIATIGKTEFSNFFSTQALLAMGDNTRQVYFQVRTQMGFLIPIVLHLASLGYMKLYILYLYESISTHKSFQIYTEANRLYQMNMLCILFYPLFFIALTFTRLITIMTIINFMISGKGFYLLKNDNLNKLFAVSLIVLLLFGFYFYGPCRFFDFALKPFFTFYLLK